MHAICSFVFNKFNIRSSLETIGYAAAQWIVLPDQKEMEWIYKKQKKVLADYAGNIQQFYGFDSDGTDKKQNAFYDEIINMLQNREYECRVGIYHNLPVF